MSRPLYRRLLGPDFDKLPARVRELHDLDGVSVWQGRAKVERGRSPVSRIAATLSSLPPEGDDQPLRVTFATVGDKEIWARQFGKALFRSVQYERGGLLRERVAISTFVFATVASADPIQQVGGSGDDSLQRRQKWQVGQIDIVAMNTESLSVLAGRPANISAITFRRVFDSKSEVAEAFRQRHQADIMSVLTVWIGSVAAARNSVHLVTCFGDGLLT
jgi:hypothetical protein